MKKNYFKHAIVPLALLLSTGTAFSQSASPVADAEFCPAFSTSKHEKPQAMWSLLYNYDLAAVTGGNGNAAVCFINNEFWVSRWANDTLINISATGTLISKFKIAGVTGTRSLTTDGTSLYAGVNTGIIQKINPTTKTLAGTITAPGTIPNVRSLTYDATANSNAGGFWCSTWATDITQISMTGTQLNNILAADHMLTGMYGTAFDKNSPGGPFLWVFDQAYSAAKSDIIQINVATGMQYGVFHDVMSDVGLAAADTSGLAGGLHVAMAGPMVTIMGVLQGGPTNRLFGYEVNTTGINESSNANDFVSVYPNPVQDFTNIKVNKTDNSPASLQIIDMVGKVVFESTTVGLNNYINLSKYQSGLYFAKVTYKGNTFTTKLVKE
jgi:hypothetical protein